MSSKPNSSSGIKSDKIAIYQACFISPEYEEKLLEVDAILEARKKDKSISIDDFLNQSRDRKSKKKKKSEDSLLMDTEDLRKLFDVIKKKADIGNEDNSFTSKGKREKEEIIINLLAGNEKALNVFRDILSECKKNIVAHNNRFVKIEPIWQVGVAVVLTSKFKDDYINIGFGNLKSVPVEGSEIVQVEIRQILEHAEQFVNGVEIVTGSIIDYPYSLLSKYMTEQDNRLLSNPPPSRRNILPVNNLLIFDSRSTRMDIGGEESVMNVDRMHVDQPIISDLDRITSNNSDSGSSNINQIANNPIPNTIQNNHTSNHSLVPTNPIHINSNPILTNSSINNQVVTNLHNSSNNNKLSFISNHNNTTLIAMNSNDNIPASALLHNYEYMFGNDGISNPNTNKPFLVVSTKDMIKLLDSYSQLIAHYDIMKMQIDSDSQLINSFKILASGRKIIDTSVVAVQTVIILFGQKEKVITKTELANFKKIVHINHALDKIVEWFDLEESNLSNHEQQLKTFLSQYHKGLELNESSLRNRNSKKPPKKKRKQVQDSSGASSSNDQ
ncbi:predicted protein [Naegleria gruberi]|uniref:Predicted protein n=1 Tax=Naegleria gruberi TaxID=5762 RepID=D2VNY4_NAEGR|nr:uncharacterized protein NAEGRDRAFT_70662 [Naegleria gruberi]EFC41500.1 predicted protein [Naegleria gruberi]|eukprot:XP_002674244.1 predicted protein [Naegleria gruberi strain NEG-M]